MFFQYNYYLHALAEVGSGTIINRTFTHLNLSPILCRNVINQSLLIGRHCSDAPSCVLTTSGIAQSSVLDRLHFDVFFLFSIS